MKKYMKNKEKVSTLVGVVVLLIIAITASAFVWVYEKGQVPPPTEIQIPDAQKGIVEKNPLENNNSNVSYFTKNTYTNYRYKFQITLPEDWNIGEFNYEKFADPVFVFYKHIPDSKIDGSPLASTFTDGTFVLVLPHGQSSHGLPGKTIPSTIKLSGEIQLALDYVLKDETRWATMIKYKNQPNAWNESGFIFGKNLISNKKENCERSDIIIEQTECDLLGGDTVTYSGTINAADRKQIELILSSFKFIR